MLRYFLEKPSPLKRYVVNFLAKTAGYAAEESSSANGAHLFYGNNADCDCPVKIPERSSDTLWAELLSNRYVGSLGRLPFDIISATGAFLTDEVNAGERAYDIHDRLVFESSFQASHSCQKLAVVNAYARVFRDALVPVIGQGLPLWPRGQQAAIGLSHDVDRLDRWAAVRETLRTHRYPESAAISIVRNFLWPHDDSQLFREVLDYEHHLGFKSTFFFAATSRYDVGANTQDVPYSIHAPVVRNAIEYVLNRGFEVGLHASYNALRSAEHLRAERERLAKVSQAPVIGLRHHFWHTGRDLSYALALHEKAGFSYDTSIAWNSNAGFRRSVASYYRPWHPGERREIDVLQLPVFAMDGNFFYHKGITAEAATESLMGLVGEIVRYNGMGVVDWHSDTSHPNTPAYREWGRAYFDFLQQLSLVPDVWVTSLGEIATWLCERERRLTYLECSS